MRHLALVSVAVTLLASLPALGQADARRSSEERMGAVVAPAALPAGASSVWATLGVPELAVGYRQGFGVFELGARAQLDYLRLGLSGEVEARVQAFEERWFALAPSLGLGLTGETGASYFDADNVAVFALRVHPGLLATARVGETLALLAAFDLPMDFGLSRDYRRIKALAGLGAELYVGSDVSLLLMVQGGAEGLTSALGGMRWGPAIQVRFGLGFRLF